VVSVGTCLLHKIEKHRQSRPLIGVLQAPITEATAPGGTDNVVRSYLAKIQAPRNYR
jgi:hypothetical protein